MAKNASTETPEAALLDDTANGQVSVGSAEFNALMAWIDELEAKDPTIRVHQVLTKYREAPDYIRVRYSYPEVKVAEMSGYAKGDGSIVLFGPK
ncbi:MAG: hypothetical protein RL563_1094 [Pseudomonadota bacterium]|jgi:type II secretory pathway component PulM